jgi:hypothetical protein
MHRSALKFRNLYWAVYALFALCAGAVWLGWVPLRLLGVIGIAALGAFLHEWRSRVASEKARKSEEASMIAELAPELRGMENDFVAQAAYARKAVDAFKSKASKEEARLLAETYSREVEIWQNRHDGELAGPWLSVATLRRIEAAILASKQYGTEKREQPPTVPR